jgi:hypothetical protein
MIIVRRPLVAALQIAMERPCGKLEASILLALTDSEGHKAADQVEIEYTSVMYSWKQHYGNTVGNPSSPNLSR